MERSFFIPRWPLHYPLPLLHLYYKPYRIVRLVKSIYYGFDIILIGLVPLFDKDNVLAFLFFPSFIQVRVEEDKEWKRKREDLGPEWNLFSFLTAKQILISQPGPDMRM